MQSRWILYSMIFSSLLLTALVAYWLRDSYHKAQFDLHQRSDLVFNQAVRNAEDSILRWRFRTADSLSASDSNFNIRIEMDTLHLTRELLSPTPQRTIIVRDDFVKKDSLYFKSKSMNEWRRPHDLFSAATIIVQAAGSDKEHIDTMMVRLIENHFNQDADQSFPKVSYEFKRFPGPIRPDHNLWITQAYFDPVSGNRLAVVLTPTLWDIARQIWPQGLFSLILLTCTFGAFILSWRTLNRQQILTEMKDNFVSNMTHELKTPIATVSVALEALENFRVLENPQKTAEYLDMSKRELSRLQLLVDQVLKTTSIDSGNLTFHLEPVDLAALTSDIVDSLKLQTDKINARIDNQANGVPPILADRMHLTNVLYNLVDNGLKYSPEKPHLEIAMSVVGNSVQWSITDHGIGIKLDDQERIFDKFFRVAKGNTHDVKGYGLGLYYVRQVMQRLNGTVNVSSQPGQGSRFDLTFPKVAEP
ncbi:MAG: HAMP domain-containing sensor histidine kinase [Saprospiraceae bacterium]